MIKCNLTGPDLQNYTLDVVHRHGQVLNATVPDLERIFWVLIRLQYISIWIAETDLEWIGKVWKISYRLYRPKEIF